ncbi:PD40 domain-containing protein [Natronogracilivirga saccharolytica]|uniref:PD40 domain-containing protein n=1 Tax=Natronogracilivirga saccharolytica TaxID=2812953 RepID=A0A8J7RKZ7_9BACT|nr:PD40 domain-containing protein [Natronogracilivirga saccharolytica]MBP3191599.1 PD40 domain-containing protein [Natronogracilivirga saccharolytica]
MRFQKLYFIPVIITILLVGDIASGQVYDNFYRPSRPAWQQLETDHFRILYQKGEESAAIQTANILEDQYSVVQSLVGGSLSDMPVVLNSQNERSNGYVTTLNFRIEVEIPRLKGKTMNPRDGNWLLTVMPHELVHALHLNVIPTAGVSGFIRPFSPDAARTMHMAAPLGMIEGIAVFHESHRHFGVSGRGNHPYFKRQFHSIFDSRKRWSLDQMMMNPARTFPFDRHYSGGHEFIRWLQYEYGMETTKNTIRFVSRWPFLGYGTALWYHTRKRPSTLYKEFEEDRSKYYKPDPQKNKTIFESPDAVKMKQIRRPFWISDDVLVFHARSYGDRQGFYSYNFKNDRTSLFYETGTVEDHVISSHPDGKSFLYSRYHRHPYYNNYERMRVHEITHDGSSFLSARPVSKKTDRLHAPSYASSNKVWGLQTHHERNQLIQLSDEQTDTLFVPEKGHMVEVAFHPGSPDSLALLANRNGIQGLWLLHRDQIHKWQSEKADISFNNASVYDPVWHPDGDRLLFTSDFKGILNLYEYDIRKNRLHRLTNHKYGIMEGRFDPDGNRIAAVQFLENRFELVILGRKDIDPVPVDDKEWKRVDRTEPSPPASADPDSMPENWTMSSYRTGLGWLRPRAFFPYWENETRDIGHRFGLTMSSGDVLRKNSYFAEVSTSNSRLWYDLEYQYSGFFPGFRLKGYQRPVQTTAGLIDRQGFGVDIPIRLQIDQNTRFSAFTVIPGVDHLRQRQIDTDGQALGPWFDRTTAGLFASYQHRIQQNIGDVQPNTGWLLFGEYEQDIQTDLTQQLSALRAGLYKFTTLSTRSNQSLRIGTEWVTQNLPYFDISGFFSRGFDDNILDGVNNSSRFHTRYTIPLHRGDRGNVLFPVFYDIMYATLFSDTIIPLTGSNTSELIGNSRTLYGVGIRFQMRLFNIPVDMGVAFAYEPTRENASMLLGSF